DLLREQSDVVGESEHPLEIVRGLVAIPFERAALGGPEAADPERALFVERAVEAGEISMEETVAPELATQSIQSGSHARRACVDVSVQRQEQQTRIEAIALEHADVAAEILVEPVRLDRVAQPTPLACEALRIDLRVALAMQADQSIERRP